MYHDLSRSTTIIFNLYNSGGQYTNETNQTLQLRTRLHFQLRNNRRKSQFPHHNSIRQLPYLRLGMLHQHETHQRTTHNRINQSHAPSLRRFCQARMGKWTNIQRSQIFRMIRNYWWHENRRYNEQA